MNYLTNYYKNLCEQLQEKVSILEAQLNEAGFRAAMKSGDPEKIKKQLEIQKARRENKLESAAISGLRAIGAQTKNLKKSGVFQKQANAEQASALSLGSNIEEIEMQLALDPTMQKKTTGSYQY
jgi:hypothetical protein